MAWLQKLFSWPAKFSGRQASTLWVIVAGKWPYFCAAPLVVSVQLQFTFAPVVVGVVGT
jgi:hypothetical protein